MPTILMGIGQTGLSVTFRCCVFGATPSRPERCPGMIEERLVHRVSTLGGVAQRESRRLASDRRGFDSLHLHHAALASRRCPRFVSGSRRVRFPWAAQQQLNSSIPIGIATTSNIVQKVTSRFMPVKFLWRSTPLVWETKWVRLPSRALRQMTVGTTWLPGARTPRAFARTLGVTSLHLLVAVLCG